MMDNVDIDIDDDDDDVLNKWLLKRVTNIYLYIFTYNVSIILLIY